MRIIKIPKNKTDASAISQAVRLLKQGGVLVYPTETAYGLGCDFTNKEAREKIYKIKGRKASKKLPVIVSDVRMARRYAVFDAVSGRLAERYWPGPLTLVLRGVETPACRQGRQNFASVHDPPACRPACLALPAMPAWQAGLLGKAGRQGRQNFASVRNKKNTIALRVSSHKIARLLSKKLGRPIVSTSANVSGKGNCYNAEEIVEQFKGRKHRPDLILDYGRLPEAPSSTVARVAGGEVKMLRRGGIKIS